jgi:hypothetical protein
MTGPAEVAPLDGIAFARVVREVFFAVERGELDLFEAWVLAVLYNRQRGRFWVVWISAGELMRATGWPHDWDWLYRKLTSLKRKGWVDFPTTPGKKHPTYAITLRHEAGEQTEQGPSTQRLNDAEASTANATTGPSTTRSQPSSEQPSRADREPDSGVDAAEPDRARRDVRDKTTTLPEGKALGEASPNYAYEVGEGTDQPWKTYDPAAARRRREQDQDEDAAPIEVDP